jgi:dipeptidyl aminopeptidase/acylaminoacyl peptidase
MNYRVKLAAILISSAPVVLLAQPMQLTENLGKTVLYGDISLSPDGRYVAWAQSTAATSPKQIHIRAVLGDAPASGIQLDVSGDRTDAEPVWSPDSKTLAFFSTAGEKEQKQLWTVSADGSGAKKLTKLSGYAARPHWSPDGKRIAFLYIEGAGGGGPLFAAPPTTGVVDTAIHNQRIAVIDVVTGELQQVSPENLHVYDYDFSPDGKTFAATAAPGPGDNNWWIAQLYTIDASTGKATSIYKPSLQIAVPRWSADGKSIAFIEGIMSDEGFHGGDLLTVPATGGDAINHTRGRKTSVSSLFCLGPNRVLVTEYSGGGSAISEFNLSDNSTRPLWKGDEGIHAFGNFPNFALSADGKFAAAVRSNFNTPPEVWMSQLALTRTSHPKERDVTPGGDWRQLTNNNSALTPTWGKAESIQWNNEGFAIQGWVIPPATVDSGKKYPMIVLIHGGPSGVTTPEWPAGFGMSRAMIAALSAHGYYLLLPNPRGSYGQGENFTRANVKDFGHGDLRDVMAGVEVALKKYPVDQTRLGVTGWSYGGFMTMWTVTQTTRFAAAVAGAGIANWQSYYGQNLIDQWMIPFFGASVYDDPAVYEKSSPIKFIKNVKTPTLIIVGERDAECPPVQSYEFWHALRALGVPTRLIVYPGEGHLFVKPEHQTDRMDQTVAWFNKYLK